MDNNVARIDDTVAKNKEAHANNIATNERVTKLNATMVNELSRLDEKNSHQDMLMATNKQELDNKNLEQDSTIIANSTAIHKKVDDVQNVLQTQITANTEELRLINVTDNVVEVGKGSAEADWQ